MQRWKKHLWTGTLLSVSVLLIIAAVAMGVVRLVDLAAPKYRDQLSSKLSESLDLPVTIEGLGMSWQAFRPTFELDRVVILDDSRRPVFQVGHIGLPFKWGSLLKGELFPYLIQLNDLAVSLEWRPDGSIGISGVDAGEDSGELDLSEILAYLERINRIEVIDGVINWNDFGVQIGLTRVEQVNAYVQRTDDGLGVSVTGKLPRHLGEDFLFEADIEGDLAKPAEMQISTFFSTDSLFADGWLAPVLRETAALRGGPIKVQFASHWQGLVFKDAALRIAANPLQDVGGDQPVELPGVNAELKILPLGDGWDMDILSLQYSYKSGKSPVSRGGFRYQPTPDGFGTRLDAELDSLRIADLMAWLSVLGAVEGQTVPVGPQVKGQLLNTRFEYYQAIGSEPQFSLSSLLSELGLPATEMTPGVKGLNGRLYLTQAAGRFEASTESGELDFPKVFSEPLPLDDFKTILHWEVDDGQWKLFSEELRLKFLSLEAEGKLEFVVDAQDSPVIDLTLDFSSTDIVPLKPFIPLPPALSLSVGEWLGASLQAGRVPSGKFELKGRLSDFPYVNPGEEGVFRIEFRAVDTTLAYSPGWPEVKGITGDAVFQGRSMEVRAEKGTILDVPISHTVAAIPDFLVPVLKVKGQVQADVGKQLNFLEASPLRDDYMGLLNAITITGPGRLDLDLALPLGDVNAVEISGDIQLQGAQLIYAGLPDPVTDIRGDLQFSKRGLSAKQLTGKLLELPVQASLTPEAGATDGMTALHASAVLSLPGDASKLSAYVEKESIKQLSGSTTIHVESKFDSSASSSELVVRTDLKGMKVGLGKPFSKREDEVRNLNIRIRPDKAQTDLHWAFANRLQGALRFRTDKLGSKIEKGRIHLGQSKGVALPDESALIIEGSLPALDMTGFPVSGGGASMQFPDLNVATEIGELRIAGQVFRDFKLHSVPPNPETSSRDTGSLKLQSKEAVGTLKWNRGFNNRWVLTGKFDRLHLNMPPGLDEKVIESVPDNGLKEPAVDPSKLPLFNLEANNFRLGNEGLGTFKLDTQAIDTGFRIALLEIGGRRIEVRGGGEWVRHEGKSSARLVMNINGNDIVGLLNATGYAPSITAEMADIFMELDWTPDERGLEMENLNGKMSFDLQDGSLLDVQPGAGRVLSLLSFYSLPRRLTLDFSDVLGKGTAFDKLTGDFAIVKGNATTDNLNVDMPSAHIEVRGRVGLAARDYDQTVTIMPEITSGVALAGAVLGGPVLGIGLWIAQEFLDKPFDQVAQVRYRLTGTWEDPKVEALEASKKTGKKNRDNKSSSKKAGPKAIQMPQSSSESEQAVSPDKGVQDAQ